MTSDLWSLYRAAMLARWRYKRDPSDDTWDEMWEAYAAYFLACQQAGSDVEPIEPPANRDDDDVAAPEPPEKFKIKKKGKGKGMKSFWRNQTKLEEMSRSRSDWTITNRGLNEAQQNSANQQAMATATAGNNASMGSIMESIAGLNGLTQFSTQQIATSQFMQATTNPGSTATANAQLQLAASKMGELMGILSVLVAPAEVAASGAAAAAAAAAAANKPPVVPVPVKPPKKR